MAKKKISGLPAGSALNGTELVPIVQAGTTKRTTAQDIANLGNASSVSGSGTINRLAKFTGASALGNSNIQDSGSLVSIGVSTLINTGTANQNTKIFGDKVSMSRTSDAAEVVYFSKNTDLGASGTANINGYDGIQFRTQGAETVKATITSAGNVGIGTISPAVLLQLGDGSLSNSTTNQYLRVNAGGYNSLSYAHLDLFNFGNNFSNPLGWRLTSGTEGAGVSIGRYLSFNTVVTDGSGNPSTATECARFSSNRNLLINTTTDVASSKLTIDSTTQGVLVPRMTTTQINAIVTPATGLIAYNTTLATLCFYDGTIWNRVVHLAM